MFTRCEVSTCRLLGGEHRKLLPAGSKDRHDQMLPFRRVLRPFSIRVSHKRQRSVQPWCSKGHARLQRRAPPHSSYLTLCLPSAALASGLVALSRIGVDAAVRGVGSLSIHF
jgi:hypothetical protein